MSSIASVVSEQLKTKHIEVRKAARADVVKLVVTSDCNPGILGLNLGSGIEKFVILGSRFGIRLTDLWSF